MTGAAMDPSAEWLEADGRGGFASGTVGGLRTRRYHALLLASAKPPTARYVLVNGFDAWVETPAGRFPLTSQRYTLDVVDSPAGRRLEAFDPDPWPRWTFALDDGTRVEQELFVRHGAPMVALAWRLVGEATAARLVVRPFLSGRDYHALHHENPSFWFDAELDGPRVTWRPYAGVPGTIVLTSGVYTHEPHWYRNFLYTEERDRGLDCVEDLASPGTFAFDLTRGEAVLTFAADLEGAGALLGDDPRATLTALRDAERARRAAFPSRLERAADAYLVQGDRGRTILAGYPWFTDWGRDTFIALRGLCLATGRLEEAGEILAGWSRAVSQGMLPNRFPDQGEEPEFNSVDAALWYVVAAHEYLQAAGVLDPERQETLRQAVLAIVRGHAEGTRYGIRMDDDGLLAAGEPGVQLTWMDARVDGREITPRIGKPVEVQALWLNALAIAATFDPSWKEALGRGRAAFAARFWNESRGCLYDVVDPDHRRGEVDPTLRPNQILAVGGLPFPVLEGERARRVVETVEETLWTPLGLRSLAPGEPGYAATYGGGVADRDGVYHQGTVWPWLVGPFVEAWLRVQGDGPETRREARARFVQPLLDHLDQAGLGHASEIADGGAPHASRGCPFQAWSVGELLRALRATEPAVVEAAKPRRRAAAAATPAGAPGEAR